MAEAPEIREARFQRKKQMEMEARRGPMGSAAGGAERS